jgi:hypothetical protein
MTKEEIISNAKAIWQQSETARTYRCPVCLRPVFSQHEGDEIPAITCEAGQHRLRWETQDAP